jgi:hypothetical protein
MKTIRSALLHFRLMKQHTDSVAPVAMPCKIRHAMCVSYDWLFAAPIVLPRSKRQQPSRTGRRPKTMQRGKIMKAPVLSQWYGPTELGHQRSLPKAMTKLG